MGDEYYTFGTKYPEGVQRANRLDAIPPRTIQPLLAQQVRNSMHKNDEEMKDRPRMPSCCMGTPPCNTQVSYRPRYGGCGDMWMTWDQASGGRYMSEDNPPIKAYEIGQKADGIWVANLGPLHYEQSILRGAEWHAETSTHPRARQLFAQFLMSTLNPQSDPHTKKIDSLADSYPSLVCRYGPMQYTSF